LQQKSREDPKAYIEWAKSVDSLETEE